MPTKDRPDDTAPGVPGAFGVDEDPYTDDDSLGASDPENHDD